jgi:hypothetical protein
MKIENKIEDYYRKYEVKRCFVLGNGPSLKDTNLDLLKDEYSFAINRIDLLYDKYDWRPSVYCSFSERQSPNWNSSVKESLKLEIPVFLNEKHKNVYHRENPIHWLKCSGSQNFNERKTLYGDITRGVHKDASTLLAMIEVVNYMGFKEVYLLGCDLNYQINKISHFDENYFPGNGFGSNAIIYNNEMRKMHHSILKHFTKEGKIIKNATVGGSLEVYERVDYYELLKK